jgi:hypothetical protein
MHLKVFVKLKKTLKNLSSGQKNPKNPKKTKNPKKPKKPKNSLGWFFFKKNRVFSNPVTNTFEGHEQLLKAIFLGTLTQVDHPKNS